jgi:hypothetical protein
VGEEIPNQSEHIEILAKLVLVQFSLNMPRTKKDLLISPYVVGYVGGFADCYSQWHDLPVDVESIFVVFQLFSAVFGGEIAPELVGNFLKLSEGQDEMMLQGMCDGGEDLHHWRSTKTVPYMLGEWLADGDKR